MKIISFIALLFVCILSFGQNSYDDNSKQPKINYQWHDGTALLKTGLPLEGKFKFLWDETDVPKWIFKDMKGTLGKRKIDVPLFEKVVLNAGEKGVSAYKDSTVFVWLDEFDNLLRKVRVGDIELYDNSKILNEDYEFVMDYKLSGKRTDFGATYLENVKDLKSLMLDRPYFMQSAKATGKFDSRDLRVIVYLVDLYNDENPLRYLKWENAEITLKNGDRINANAFLQPLDLRNEFKTNQNAYVHVYDDNGFRLIDHSKIERLSIQGQTYEFGFFGIANKYFFGIPWSYNGDDYIVVKKIVNRNSYFYQNRNSSIDDLLILKKVSGTFVKVANESMLKIQYLQELNQ